jgi:restriction system protein
MPRPKRADRRRENARRELAGKGWSAIVVGVMLVAVVPLFLRGPLVALGPTLRPVGWLALAIGVALLALHYLIRRIGAPASVDTAPKMTRPGRNAPSSASATAKAVRQAPVFSTETPDLSSEPKRLREPQWSPSVLAAIEWRRFEALCEAFFAQAGLATRSQSHGADGGVDIWLQSKHMDATRIVQCKHWLSKPVGVKEVREFRGVMASHELQSGTYVTSSTFTADATAFAKANRIQLQDGAALLKLIGQRTPEQQAALLAVAHEGEYWKPTCASCGIKTVDRERKRDGSKFWGCSNYPRCKSMFVMRSA